jgi:hypothetical protein
VSAPAMPASQLALLLEDTAAGICADAAAVELIVAHGHFLHSRSFRRIIAAGSAIGGGEPAVVIRWRAAAHALQAGLLPCTRSEAAVLQIAASIGDDSVPVHLRTLLGSLDSRNIALVTAAITAANGS